jgi:hypothetical protein
MMFKKESNSPQLPGFEISPIVLIRTSSILFMGLMIGHMSAYPWAASHNPQEIQLVESMKAIDFVFMGEHSTYWNLYYGWGVLVAVLLLALAVILWLLSDLARIAPRPVGLITGFLSVTCLIGAYLSFVFFFIPPAVLFSVICIALIATTVRLLSHQK